GGWREMEFCGCKLRSQVQLGNEEEKVSLLGSCHPELVEGSVQTAFFRATELILRQAQDDGSLRDGVSQRSPRGLHRFHGEKSVRHSGRGGGNYDILRSIGAIVKRDGKCCAVVRVWRCVGWVLVFASWVGMGCAARADDPEALTNTP